jgi:hypothetical protein
MIRVGLILLFMFVSAGVALPQSGGVFTITRAAFAAGGANMTGGVFAVNTTLGQPSDGAASSGGTFTATGGLPPNPPVTTAGTVSISGRIVTVEGRGIRSAFVEIVDPSGTVRSVRTGPMGTYRIDNIEVGRTYLMNVSSQRFVFAPRSVSVTDQLVGIDFTGYLP